MDIRVTRDQSRFVIVGKQEGTTSLLLIKDDGGQLQFTIRVIAADAHKGFGGRENIRLDLYFVLIQDRYSHQIGLNWPGNIGSTITPSEAAIAITGGSGQATQSAFQILPQTFLPSFDLAQAKGWAKMYRQATLVTANGTEAVFTSGGEFNVQVQNNLTVNVQAIEFGTKISVLPKYDSKTGRIELEIVADVSDLDAEKGVRGIPGRITSHVETLVNLELGQSVSLAGIRARTERRKKNGIPGLALIPFIGALFGTNFSRNGRQRVLHVGRPVSRRADKSESTGPCRRSATCVREFSRWGRRPRAHGPAARRARRPAHERKRARPMTGGFAVSVLTPDGSEQKINIAEIATLTIGRDPSCHVVLPSPAVSRIHLRVERSSGGVRVVDQSANGTTLGDELVGASGMLLSPDGALRVGPYVLRIAPLAAAAADGARRRSSGGEFTARFSTTSTSRRSTTPIWMRRFCGRECCGPSSTSFRGSHQSSPQRQTEGDSSRRWLTRPLVLAHSRNFSRTTRFLKSWSSTRIRSTSNGREEFV